MNYNDVIWTWRPFWIFPSKISQILISFIKLKMNTLVSFIVKLILPEKYMPIKKITDLPFVGHFGFRSFIFSPC